MYSNKTNWSKRKCTKDWYISPNIVKLTDNKPEENNDITDDNEESEDDYVAYNVNPKNPTETWTLPVNRLRE